MPEAQIENPQGVHSSATAADARSRYGRKEDVYKNSSTTVPILDKDVVVFDQLETANGELTVHKADVSADDPALIAGVACEAIPVSDYGKIVTLGPTIVNISDGTVSEGERAVFHATADGCADSAAADATTVEGDTFGVMLGAEIGATNTAWVKVD